MKRILFCLIFALFCMSSNAQKHLEFLGIPLNGHINNFTSRLKAKGVTVHPDNKYVQTGNRLFSGYFYDQKADILVSYNTRTGTVYKALVTIYENNEELLHNLCKEIEEIVKYKYIYEHEDTKTMGGFDISLYKVYQRDEDDKPYGLIYLGTHTSEHSYYSYELNITYQDTTNAIANRRKGMGDI